MNERHLTYLIKKYLAGACSREEKQVVEDWYERIEYAAARRFLDANEEELNASIRRSKLIVDVRKEVHTSKVKRSAIKMWMYAAAAAALLTGAVVGFKMFTHPPNEKLVLRPVKSIDIHAGRNIAYLTLPNGQKVLLDRTSGVVAKQNGIDVINQSKVISFTGQLNGSVNASMMNTVATPRGGQYQVILSDGTKVWLNAASSLKFPGGFAGRERAVELTGEAYFEVAKDPNHPFHVKVNDQDIAVLGTHFNVNGYQDKQLVVATLLEGAIKLSNSRTSQILKPGNQAVVAKDNAVRLVPDVDVSEVMAWHEGLFYFNSLTIDEIMQQVTRWYDVEVKYISSKPSGTYSGKISRNTNLSEVLQVLSFNGIKYSIEGRMIIIE